MKFLLWIILLFSLPANAKSDVEVSARSYIIMEQNSGEVLEGKDIHLTRSVASISKIMTAILAIESISLYDVVTIGSEIDSITGSAIYIEKGKQITIIDLVYGLLLRSGNDAAMSIAYHIGNKSIDDFVNLMNEKASQLKMKKSIFNNPHGLDIDDDGNISCAYDMALLMRYCMNNTTFKEIISAKSYKVPNIGVWKNKNKLLHNYQYLTGGKTGFTTKAKRTLVTSASKDELDLIIVTLDAGNDFNTHKNLYEFYFNNYRYLTFLLPGVNIIENYKFYCDNKYGTIIKKEEFQNIILIYALDIERLSLTIKVCYENKIDEFGPYKINKMELINA